jgi:subtilisin family serine protease
MSSVVDSRLKYLQGKKKRELEVLESMGHMGLEVDRIERRIEAKFKVLVQYDGDVQALEEAGLEIRTVAGDVISGLINSEDVGKLASVDGVMSIESSRPLARELDISLSEINADQVHAGPPGMRGAGVIVGIIDTGIDITHGSFRRSGGLTRVVSIWDQSLTPAAGESSPAGFSYGVEYSSADIDAALSSPDPTSVVRHVDRSTVSGHGTHVAGIAAGDGSPPGNGFPANTFVGVASEADIIVVSNIVTTQAFGDSSQTLDAVNYIFQKAELLDKPVVINLSQGDNIGPHDGTSLLERGIDNLLGDPGRIMVKSAGNEGDRSRHAMGTVPDGGSETIGLSATLNDQRDNVIDIWYPEVDRFGFRITPPGGAPTAVVNPNNSQVFNLPGGNSVFVDSTTNNVNNNDNRIYVTISRGSAGSIQRGIWTITLIGQTVNNGDFHAWIERSFPDPTFIFRSPHRTNSHTVSIPGTSREVIAVGSYITEGPAAGNLATSSSRGPTRDGIQKPEISAPGQAIMSARAAGIASGTGIYHSISGTSMAAPHVAGVVALMLEKNGSLTQQEVRDCLMNNARSDIFTGAVPNNSWGAGKVDALAAVTCVQASTPVKFFDDGTTAVKVLDDGGGTPIKVVDDGGTALKVLDDGGGTAIKVLDDCGGTPIKAIDDGGTLFKTVDDRGGTAIKFLDDGRTPNKAADDSITANKFVDDGGGGTPIKAVDDGGGTQIKFIDDGGGSTPNKAFDDVKQPGLDKDPATDNIRIGQPPIVGAGGAESEAAPFIMSTPHHSTAWMASYPSAYQQEISRYEQALQVYQAAMMQYRVGAEAGSLTEEEQAQLVQLDQEYRAILAEYEQVLKAAGLA